MPEVHALLSASGSKRWINCPASLRLEQKLPDKLASVYAEEGTRAHAVAEDKLRCYLDRSRERTAEPDDQEMDDYTDDYVGYVIEQLNEELSKTPDAKLMVETRLDFSKWVPEGFGTGDAVIVSDDTLHVIDLKYGKGVEVSAIDNPQALLYAAGAYSSFGSLYSFDRVKVHIYQPRIGNISTDEYTIDELIHKMEYVSQQAHKAYNGEKEFKCGDWCRWCKLNPNCKKKAEWVKEQKTELSSAQMTDQEIEEILPKLDEIIAWAKDIKSFALDQCLKGKRYKGWKVVEGISKRKIVNPEGLLESLESEGFDRSELLKEPELKGITQLEEIIGKSWFNELAKDFIEKPKGGPKLAPSSDKRPDYETATSDFAEELGG